MESGREWNMSRKRSDGFSMLGSGLSSHVRRTGVLDRWRRVPEHLEGAMPPAQARLEHLTRSGLARRGEDFYENVLKEYDPACARAKSAFEEAERRLALLKEEEAEAEAAATVAGAGPANDPSWVPHRKLTAVRNQRKLADVEVTRAAAALAAIEAERHAAIAAAQQMGWEHLALGRAAVHGYWEWLIRSRRKRQLPPISEMPSSLEPAPWMTIDVVGPLTASDPGEA
jgi:hypothetical protein